MKILKIQKASNNYVNLPKAWLEILRAKKGDEVIAEFDYINSKIILDFKNKKSKEEK